MKASVFNLGCKVNQYECDCMISAFKDWGIEVFNGLKNADIFVVNSCAVTREAERKSRQVLSRIRHLNSNALIFFTGCASKKNPNFYFKNNVDIVHGVKNKNLFLKNIHEKLFETRNFNIIDLNNDEEYEELISYPAISRARGYVKIQDGCDNSCSYCTITKLRGKSRSRDINEVKKEFEYYSGKVNEVVIVGINLSQYQTEKGDNIYDVIALAEEFPFRFRLGSLYIDILNEEFIKSLKAGSKFCPHFHLSLQSASTKILRDMKRNYTGKDIVKSVDLIRKYFPKASIFADIIVGYPSENDLDFLETLTLLESLKLSGLHIFRFSPREGTEAFRLKKIDASIIDKRIELAQHLDEKLRREYKLSMLNARQTLIVEKKQANGLSVGHSEYYLKIYVKTDKLIVDVKPINLYLDGFIADQV